MKRITISLLAALLVITAAGCGGGGGGSSAPASEIINDTGGVTDGSGVSSNSDITVESGNIVVNVENGQITIDGDNLELARQSDGIWQLADGISISVTDNEGNAITGTLTVDEASGTITFVPDDPLDVSDTYTVTVSANGSEYQATVIVAVDDTGNEESLFASVPLREAGTWSIQELLNDDGRAIFGWEFGETPARFKIKLTDIEEGASVYLTAYGVYSIEGHENEVYYQRWSGGDNDGKPVKDFEWSGFQISVNEEDVSLDGEEDYSFWSTYLELKVMKDGIDITAESNLNIVVENN